MSILAHNKVVVIPISEDLPIEPSINMQCQDGGINQYPSCFECSVQEQVGCCANEYDACIADGECLALGLCISQCSTEQCVVACRSIRSAPTIALHDAIGLCISGSGEPNLDGACGLVCPTPP